MPETHDTTITEDTERDKDLAELAQIFRLGEQLASVAGLSGTKERKRLAVERIIKDAQAMIASEVLNEWDIYTLYDAYEERPDVLYCVAGLFSLPSLSIVYGAPGCLKSMLLASMALCVASGLPWLPGDGVQAIPTLMTPVLWLDFDNGTRRTHERIEALARSRQIDPAITPFNYVSMPCPWLNASDLGSIGYLTDKIQELNAGLVVIDNLGTVSGDADENSAQMINVLANFRQVSESTKSAVVLIHHQRKSTGYNSRAGESLRGHSSIEAALDLSLLIERDERSSNVTIKSTKSRGVDVHPFGAEFQYTWKPRTKELQTAQFVGVRVETWQAKTDRTILETVEDEPGINKSTLRTVVRDNTPGDIGVGKVITRIEQLVSDGKLSVRAGRHNAQLFYTSEDDF